MPFDAPHPVSKRIAIIGGGITGLAAAYSLAARHEVTLFEAEHRFGGHARTVTAGINGDQPVDTGFIVFNYANYPNLTRMFQDLDVPVAKSDMGFGATIDNGAVEYGLRDITSLFGQPRNLLRPGFLRMLRDIMRFNARAEAIAVSDDVTIGDLMRELGLGQWFQRYYLLPISGAIWSTPVDGIMDFPARSLVRFFQNHALLSARGQHQWWTVQGGSIEYVTRLVRHLEKQGVKMRCGAPVKAVSRGAAQTVVHLADSLPETFDHVIFACHSDIALRLLQNPTSDEQRTLGALKYQDNKMVLHRDPGQMPRRRACWSAWVYKADHARPSSGIGVTYWMNRLQNIPESDPLFVTLNPADEIPQELIYDEKVFRHPVFDRAAIRAQGELARLQGVQNTWFAGAYARHGFHEDGFASALRVVRQIEKEFA
jgi:predicted NAD/FAD-binding protein